MTPREQDVFDGLAKLEERLKALLAEARQDEAERRGIRLGDHPEPGQARDVVHIAIIPCIAGEELHPGVPVHKVEEGVAWRALYGRVNPIGIVDPWLLKPVQTGGRFWLLVTPGTITSLRHEWSHPAFPTGDGPAPAEPTEGSTDLTAERIANLDRDDDDDDAAATADARWCREEGCWP